MEHDNSNNHYHHHRPLPHQHSKDGEESTYTAPSTTATIPPPPISSTPAVVESIHNRNHHYNDGNSRNGPRRTLLGHRNSLDPSLEDAFHKRVEELDNGRVLVVDDDLVTRNVLSKLLEKMGYNPSKAEGGIKALEMMNEEAFQFVLIDVMMPEMDGYNLMRMMKQADKKDMQCIMMSGSEDPETASKCFQVGAEDFLQKPIHEEILRQRIEKCMEYRNRRIRKVMYEDAIQREAQLRKSLNEQLEKDKQEIDDYTKRVSESIETPMQAIMNSIAELVNGTFEQERYKMLLMSVLKALSESDLYKPAFVDYIRKADIDKQTRQWLISQYTKEDLGKIFHTGAQSPSTFMGRRLSISPDKFTSMTDSDRSSGSSESPIFSHMTTHNQHSLGKVHNDDEEEAVLGEEEDEKEIVGEEEEEKLPFDLAAYTPSVDLSKLDYNALSFDKQELQKHVMCMFHDLDLFVQFSINPVKFWKFLERLSNVYRSNQYHNFRHAVDVTQFSYVIVQVNNISKMLDAFDKFVLLISALCHDIDHPGVNNLYLMNSYDDLALRYNDRSILENHHVAYAFRLFLDPQINILDGLSAEGYREFRRTVVEVILATDMANHFAIMSKFETRLSTGSLSRDHPSDRILLLRILMKCADINNISRPFNIARAWAELVTEEFTHQGDLERENGFEISPNMDRNTLNFPKSQRDFADFIVLPLFKLLRDAMHDTDFIYRSILSHRHKWDSILLEQQDEKWKEEQQDEKWKKKEQKEKKEQKKQNEQQKLLPDSSKEKAELTTSMPQVTISDVVATPRAFTEFQIAIALVAIVISVLTLWYSVRNIIHHG